jgi:hypothetical protein
VDLASGQVAGFYTLASSSIVLAELPPAITKRLPLATAKRALFTEGTSG